MNSMASTGSNNLGPSLCQIKQEPNTLTEAVSAIKQGSNTLTEAGLKKIIELCQNHLQEQTKSVQEIVNLCAQISGYDYYCHQMGTFCNQIISEALDNGLVIIQLYKSFTDLDFFSNPNLELTPLSFGAKSLRPTQVSKSVFYDESNSDVDIMTSDSPIDEQSTSPQNLGLNPSPETLVGASCITDQDGLIRSKSNLSPKTLLGASCVTDQDGLIPIKISVNLESKPCPGTLSGQDGLIPTRKIPVNSNPGSVGTKTTSGRSPHVKIFASKFGSDSVHPVLNTHRVPSNPQPPRDIPSSNPQTPGSAKSNPRPTSSGGEQKADNKPSSGQSNDLNIDQSDDSIEDESVAQEEEPDLRDPEWSMEDEFGERKNNFQCSVCSKTFKSEKFFERHQRFHKSYKCPFCVQTFARKSILKEHKTKQHKDELDDWDPDNCSDYDEVEGKRKKAKKTTLADLTCDICEKHYSNIHNLRKHKLITHSHERPFTCELCEKHFKSKNCLRTHKLTHLTTRPFTCDLCDYGTVSRSRLNKHMTVHSNEKRFQCEECGYKLSEASTLKNHMTIHTGAKPYACDICDKKFSIKLKMKVHRRTHTNDMKYSCDICGKRSHQHYNIVVHMRTHTGHKPFSCNICGKKFAHNVSLRDHKNSCRPGIVHQEEKIATDTTTKRKHLKGDKPSRKGCKPVRKMKT